MFDEITVLSKIKDRFRPVSDKIVLGIGDDCAAVSAGENLLKLYTTDTLLEGVHFSTSYMTHRDVGKKAVSVSVSDIAAMGGMPRYFLSTIGLPKNIQEKCIDEIFSGFVEGCDLYGIELIGGNVTASDKLLIDITVIGEVEENKIVKRSGAKAGDLVFVTGNIGDSAMGLEILRSGNDEEKDYFADKHINPTARVKPGKLLADEYIATSMIDISDGFLIDLERITTVQGLGADIYSEKIPLSENYKSILKPGEDNLLFALSGGEDYELLFTAEPGSRDKISELEKRLDVKLSEVGIVTDQQRINLYSVNDEIINYKTKGFVHHWNLNG